MAEREIIAAAEELLRERPFRDLTVDEVMRRTELSRPSFYVYFRDRHHLVLRVVERFGAEMWTMSERWFEGSGPGGVRIRDSLGGVAAVFERHGPVLHALADAATFGERRRRRLRVTELLPGLTARSLAPLHSAGRAVSSTGRARDFN